MSVNRLQRIKEIQAEVAALHAELETMVEEMPSSATHRSYLVNCRDALATAASQFHYILDNLRVQIEFWGIEAITQPDKPYDPAAEAFPARRVKRSV